MSDCAGQIERGGHGGSPDAAASVSVPIFRALMALVLAAFLGLPGLWFVLGAVGRVDLQVPGMVSGAVVLLASMLGLIPLWMTRGADPMTQAVTGRLLHVMVRLLLTAGGLLLYLVSLPVSERLMPGLLAVGWYVAGWIIEWFLIYKPSPQGT